MTVVELNAQIATMKKQLEQMQLLQKKQQRQIQQLKQQMVTHNRLCSKFLTFSFQVEATNEIKCYLYFNGQRTRFFPQDIIQILPYLFVNSAQNEIFKKEKAPSIIKKMKKEIEKIKLVQTK